MNFKEVIKELQKQGIELENFAFGDFGTTLEIEGKKQYDTNVVPNIGTFVEVEQVGGEGSGDHWHSVKYIKELDMYIKVTGYYASYDGTSFNGWEDAEEVKPQEKTITVYE